MIYSHFKLANRYSLHVDLLRRSGVIDVARVAAPEAAGVHPDKL